MSKLLFSLVVSILIVYISCGECSSKYIYEKDETTGKPSITDGTERKVWNHADSCNYLQVTDENLDENEARQSCCYIHVEYKSNIDGNRYDKYGCINVGNPYKEYEGTIDNVKAKVQQVEEDFNNAVIEGTADPFADDVHVKIVCSSSFLKFSVFALLAIILF